MASLSGVSSSNTVSSLMNSANMISGLASGLDTESMIENLVKGYQTKISQLNQKVTKTEWKQDAYRSIIQKMVGFSNKYTSYTSNTNLTSPSFFSNAVKVLTKGTYADSVTASGKTSSDISLNAVHQLARAAQYRTKGSDLLNVGTAGTIAASEGVDLSADAEKNIELANLQGSLTLTYGTKTVSVSFSESSTAKELAAIREKNPYDSDTEVLASYINQKLADEKIIFNNGNSESADKRIKAVADGDSIRFEEQGTGQNGVYISGASGNIAKQFGLSEDDLENAKENKLSEIDTSGIASEDGEKGLTRKLNAIEYLSEKSQAASDAGVKLGMNISLNGSTKTIEMPEVRVEKNYDGTQYYLNGKEIKAVEADPDNGVEAKTAEEVFAEKYTAALQDEVKKAFKDKVTVENKGADGKLQLEFKVKNEGDELVINTGLGDALGIGNTATSYLNTSKTLGDLLKLDDSYALKDSDGKFVLDDEGNKQYEFKINDTVVGKFTRDSKLSDVLSAINSNKEAGVSVGYSQATQSFTFTAKETGEDSEIKMGEGLAQAMFGSTEIEDRSSSPFVDSYGLDWMTDGDSVKLTFSIPGHSKHSFDVTNKDSIQDVVDKLNKSIPMGEDYTFAYNKYSGQIEAKDKASGELTEFSITNELDNPVTFDKSKAPKIDYTAGQDAKFTVTINGEQKTMIRSSNSVNIDGLTISMNEEFDGSVDEDGNKSVDKAGNPVYKNSVTFQSKTDSDKIVDAIKSMAEDYNTMMSEIRSAYNTMPYQNSNGSFGNYEPLTDEDREGMSESAIERYEEKAKQGILFGDRNLSNLYTRMNQAFSFANTDDVNTLKDMGISVGYDINTGTQTVQIDEDKLRSMLDSDPDRVADLFTKNDGVMDRMKNQLDYYAKTTGEPKGVLIQQAGSPLSSLSLMNNTWQKQIDNYNTQIEKWQDKLSSQVDRYTQQFSRLEQLINQMNSQSSTLAGLMGG